MKTENDSFDYTLNGKKYEHKFKLCTVDLISKPIIFDACTLDVKPEELPPSGGFSTLTPDQKAKLKSLLDELLPIKPETKTKKLPCTRLIEHEIKLLKSAKPIKQRYHPLSPKLEQALHEIIDDLLARDIVKPSESEWSSPIVTLSGKKGRR